MMRCPDCNRFVAFGDMEAEVDVNVEGEGEVTVSGTLSLPCADCGTTLKELSVEETEPACEDLPEVEAVVRDNTPEALRPLVTDEWVKKNVQVEYEIDGDADVEPTERVETHKTVVVKRGPQKGQTVQKPLSARGQKTYRGVTVTGTVVRTLRWRELADDGTLTDNEVTAEDRADFTVEVEEQASAFDEVC